MSTQFLNAVFYVTLIGRSG